jgi:hypothetical protein
MHYTTVPLGTILDFETMRTPSLRIKKEVLMTKMLTSAKQPDQKVRW